MNPILNGVLAGFSRRRYNRFKFGHHTLELDRLRFGRTAREKDSDLHATEVNEGPGTGNAGMRTRRNDLRLNTFCSIFQREIGCSFKNCHYAHQCLVCYKSGYGAINW